MGALQLKETIDERPQPHRMRLSQLQALIRQNKSLVELVGGVARVEMLTKDEALQFLGFQSHLPKTHPLGMEPASVPYEHWSIDSLRIDAKKRGLDIGWAAKATAPAIIKKLMEHDEQIFNPPPMKVADETTDLPPAA